MAITITANNANGDGSGIDVTAYLGTFVSPNYSPIGFGYFSSGPNDFSGNQYAVTEQTNLIPDSSKQAIVAESGGGNSIDYDFNSHIVGGDLDAMSFGNGVTYSSGTDSFPLSQFDLRISGLGFVNQSGNTSMVHHLLDEARTGSITNSQQPARQQRDRLRRQHGRRPLHRLCAKRHHDWRWRQRRLERRQWHRHRSLQRKQG